MARQAKHLVVHGRVQGVGFRYFVQAVGLRLDLTGNVSNLPDATVEITVEGDSARIDAFIREVERGPSLARVRRVDIHDIPVTGRYATFQIEGW